MYIPLAVPFHFCEYGLLFCRSTAGTPRVSEAVKVVVSDDALLLVNEQGETVGRARDAAFPEARNFEEANAALLRRMVEGKKLAVVEVPSSTPKPLSSAGYRQYVY